MMLPRSFLYVPADREDRLAKAHTRGANAIIADLEDAVAPHDKDAALANVEAWLRHPSSPSPALWVRFNSGDRGQEEMKVLRQFPALTGVLLPKVGSSDQVVQICHQLATAAHPILVSRMIESAAALVQAEETASTPGVHQLHMGEIDLAADLGMTPGDDDLELSYARARVVVASRYAGLAPPVAPVNARIDDDPSFTRSTHALARRGFMGRDCIHPRQVAIANAVFTPDPAAVSWARDVLDRAESERGSFGGPDGSMIDEAVLLRARNLINLSATLEN